MTARSLTFVQMQTLLSGVQWLNDANNEKYALANVKDALNQAIAELLASWNDTGEGFVKDGTDISTEAGRAEYDLDDDFLYTKEGWVYNYTENYRELKPMEFNKMYYRGTSDQQGEPTHYAIVGAYSKITVGATQTETHPKMRLFPIPDAAYTIKYKYVPTGSDVLSADSDVAPIPGNFHDLVIVRAALILTIGQGLFDVQQVWGSEYRKRKQDWDEFMRSRMRPNKIEFVDEFIGDCSGN